MTGDAIPRLANPGPGAESSRTAGRNLAPRYTTPDLKGSGVMLFLEAHVPGFAGDVRFKKHSG